MNHSATGATRVQQGCNKVIQKAFSLKTSSFWHFFRSPKPHCRVATTLTGTCAGMAGRTECNNQQYPSTCHDLFHQTICAGFRAAIPRLCANFGELGPHFDKISSWSSYESDGGVNQESEKMLYSNYDWTGLGISQSSDSINHFKRSLVLNHTIVPD